MSSKKTTAPGAKKATAPKLQRGVTKSNAKSPGKSKPKAKIPSITFELPGPITDHLNRLNQQMSMLTIERETLLKGYLADKKVPQGSQLSFDPQHTVLFIHTPEDLK